MSVVFKKVSCFVVLASLVSTSPLWAFDTDEPPSKTVQGKSAKDSTVSRARTVEEWLAFCRDIQRPLTVEEWVAFRHADRLELDGFTRKARLGKLVSTKEKKRGRPKKKSEAPLSDKGSEIFLEAAFIKIKKSEEK